MHNPNNVHVLLVSFPDVRKGKRTSGHYSQVFVGPARILAEPIKLQNRYL